MEPTNIKIYPKNIAKKIVTLCTIGTILITSTFGCQSKTKCNITEEHNHIYKHKNEIEYMYQDCEYEQQDYQKTQNYVLENELGTYIEQNNLYEIKNVKEDIQNKINQRENFVQSKKAIPYTKKNKKLGFKIKWKLLSEEQNYTGIAREGKKENIKYKIYKVEKENNNYKKNSIIVETLENYEDFYIDIEDFIVLENQEQNYYQNGKVRTKK